MRTLSLTVAAAALLGTAQALPSAAAASGPEALAPLLTPCVATGAVALDHHFRSGSDSLKILLTYGFTLLTIDHDILDEAIHAKLDALYRNDLSEFASHYDACLRGADSILAGTRQAMAKGMAALGY